VEVDLSSYVGASPVKVKSQHCFSPLYVSVGDLAPTAAADGQGLILIVNVDFDVAV